MKGNLCKLEPNICGDIKDNDGMRQGEKTRERERERERERKRERERERERGERVIEIDSKRC